MLRFTPIALLISASAMAQSSDTVLNNLKAGAAVTFAGSLEFMPVSDGIFLGALDDVARGPVGRGRVECWLYAEGVPSPADYVGSRGASLMISNPTFEVSGPVVSSMGAHARVRVPLRHSERTSDGRTVNIDISLQCEGRGVWRASELYALLGHGTSGRSMGPPPMPIFGAADVAAACRKSPAVRGPAERALSATRAFCHDWIDEHPCLDDDGVNRCIPRPAEDADSAE